VRDRESIQDHVRRPIIVRCIPTAPAWRAALARAAGAECRMKAHARALFRWTTVRTMLRKLRRERW
jgi:hypothetical protein